MRMLEGTARLLDAKADDEPKTEILGYIPAGPSPNAPVPLHRRQFETKDSGERVEFDSGMRRDTNEGKPRYDLIPTMPLRRLAELYARGAEKYGDRNWQLANTQEELDRFKASGFRHFVQWLDGERDEDHAIAAVWNLFAAVFLEAKLERDVLISDVRKAMSTERPKVI